MCAEREVREERQLTNGKKTMGEETTKLSPEANQRLHRWLQSQRPFLPDDSNESGEKVSCWSCQAQCQVAGNMEQGRYAICQCNAYIEVGEKWAF